MRCPLKTEPMWVTTGDGRLEVLEGWNNKYFSTEKNKDDILFESFFLTGHSSKHRARVAYIEKEEEFCIITIRNIFEEDSISVRPFFYGVWTNLSYSIEGEGNATMSSSGALNFEGSPGEYRVWAKSIEFPQLMESMTFYVNVFDPPIYRGINDLDDRTKIEIPAIKINNFTIGPIPAVEFVIRTTAEPAYHDPILANVEMRGEFRAPVKGELINFKATILGHSKIYSFDENYFQYPVVDRQKFISTAFSETLILEYSLNGVPLSFKMPFKFEIKLSEKYRNLRFVR